MSGYEKRRHVRIHFERQVQLDFFTEVFRKCQVQNVSIGGMYVTGEFPNKVDGQCYVNLTQSGEKTYLTLEALADIVRQDEEGLALKFTSMSFESLLSLEMILLYQAREDSSDAEIKLPEDLPFEIREETSCASDKYDPFLDHT